MSDKFKVNPGDALDVTLRRKKRSTTPPPTKRVEPSGLITADEEGTRYVFRGDKGLVTLYDLATRPTSTPDALPHRYFAPPDVGVPEVHADWLNEYREAELSVPLVRQSTHLAVEDKINLGSSPDASVLVSDYLAANDVLLAGLPFGTFKTNVSTKLPSRALLRDRTFAGASVTANRELSLAQLPVTLSDAGGTGYTATPDDWKDKRLLIYGGHWGPANTADDTAPYSGAYQKAGTKRTWDFVRVGTVTGPLALVISGHQSFIAAAQGHSAFGFKVTSAPDPAAPADAPARWKTPLKVYLVPVLWAVVNTSGVFLPGSALPLPLVPLDDYGARFPVTPGVTGVVPVSFARLPVFARVYGLLAGCIVQPGGAVYYVWK